MSAAAHSAKRAADGRSAAKRYGVALLITAAVLASAASGPGLPLVGALFSAAVVISAWYGGMGPGLFAAATGIVGQALLLLSPSWSLGAIGVAAYSQWAILLLIAYVAGHLAESIRSSRSSEADAGQRALSATGALELEKRRTETVFQSVSDGIVVQDDSGKIVFANDAAAHLLGLSAGEQLRGQPADRIFAGLEPRDEDEHALEASELPGARALAGEAAPETLISYRSVESGWERWALVRARPIHDEDGHVLRAVSALHDLTERIRYERVLEGNARDLHQLTARLEVMVEQLRVEREGAIASRAEAEEALERVVTLQRVTAALSEARTPNEVADVVLARGMEALNANRGLLLAFGVGGDSIEVVRSVGVPPEHLEHWVRPTPVELARFKSAMHREDLGRSAGSRVGEATVASTDVFRKVLGTDALAMVPLTSRERALGMLVFDVPEGRRLESRDRDLLMSLGRQCAQALDRSQLFVAERAARDEAEHASRAKSQFLAVMSHELRTPLNAILGYEELLETEVSGPISSIQKHHLSRIRESTKHLLALIEQILSLSRVQGGKEDLRLEDVDASALAREVASAVEPQLQRKGLVLELDLPDSAVGLQTDPRKVRQILFNVLSNAVKFTERGSVRVSLATTDGTLFYTVLDTGPGIGEGDLEQIFEPFVQVQTDGSIPSGTGLGLAVARELARHLGGDITLQSRLGEGSAFTIRLPKREGVLLQSVETMGVTTSLDG
jgi:PAS domain S-box-containing protein